MARRIAAAGFNVTVWNRTLERSTEFAAEGFDVAETPRVLAERAELVITMVTDAAALASVLCGDDGIFGGLSPDGIVMDMSTIGPVAARKFAAEAEANRFRFIDAPVSGSVALAEQGALLVMVGGDSEAIEAVTPVLQALSKAVVHVGPVGAGAAMKLAVNAAVAITNQSIAEALALAERSGISRADAYQVLANGAVASPYVLYKRRSFLEPGDEPVAFTTALMQKDLDLALELAAQTGLLMPATTASRKVLEQACAAGFADADFARVADVICAGDPEAGGGARSPGAF
jgi:3-hydroxyisobutyrate dehydrogenase-like beta-hydroxyacid dehydrogenase